MSDSNVSQNFIDDVINLDIYGRAKCFDKNAAIVHGTKIGLHLLNMTT